MPAERRQARQGHQRARLTFSVGDDDIARLEIVDNGVGFDTFEHPLGGDEMGGYGLLSMAERAEIVGGRLNIRSRPGSGTAVTATIPLPSTPRVGTNNRRNRIRVAVGELRRDDGFGGRRRV